MPTKQEQAATVLREKLGMGKMVAEKFVTELEHEDIDTIVSVSQLPMANELIRAALDIGAIRRQVNDAKNPDQKKELSERLDAANADFEVAVNESKNRAAKQKEAAAAAAEAADNPPEDLDN